MIKWIGQHIVDFIARFRSDVYLEDIADGTVVDNKFLGLDSNNKVVKEAASTTVTDLHTAGVDGANNNLLTDKGDGTIQSEGSLTFDGSTLDGDGGSQIKSFEEIGDSDTELFGKLIELSSAGGGNVPYIELVSSNADSNAPEIKFSKTATGADGDDLGEIKFIGDDEGNGVHTYASILAEIADATPGEEAGRLSLRVAEFDGTVTTGVLINGDTNADGEVDVTLGAGVNSVTTIAGNLNASGGDHTFTSATSGKPILTIENSNTDAVSPILKFAKTATGADADEIGRIQFEADDDANNPTVFAEIKGEIQDVTNTGASEDGQLELLIAQGASLVNVLKANSNSGVGTMLEFGDGGFLGQTTFKSTVVNFESGTSAAPIFSSKNTTADALGPQFTFIKNRGDASAAGSTLNGDSCGLFNFRGFDAGGNITTYAKMEGFAGTTSAGNESGKFEITVTSDGSISSNNRNVITGTGHTTVDKVDVDLGYGTASVATIAGTLTMGTTAAMTNAGALSVAAQPNITSLGTLTALDVDNINLNLNTISSTGLDLTLQSAVDMNLVATGNDINVDTDNFTITSATGVKPSFVLNATIDSNKPSTISFVKARDSANGADGDFIGDTYYNAGNDAQEQTTFVHTQGKVRLAADGAEEGQYEIKVKNTSHASTNQNGLLISSNGAVNDVTLGHGTTSMTTIAGDLTVSGGDIYGKTDNDLLLRSDDDIALMLDSDNDGTSAVKIVNGASTNVVVIAETGSIYTAGEIDLGHLNDTTLARSAAGKVTIEGNQIVTAGAVSVASEAQVPVGIQVARRTITTGEANALHSTPIELVPAQGANTVIAVVGGMIRVDRAATQTASACDFHIHYEGEEPGVFGQSLLYHHRRFMHNETTDRVFNILSPALGGIEHADSLTEDVNAAVEASFDAAATTNCFTSIDVYVTYFVIDIS